MATDSPNIAQEMLDGLAAAADVLAARQIRYAVIGGMAAGLRSQPRTTKDLDFLLQIPQLQLPGLLDDLAARGFDCDPAVTIREWTRDHMTTLSFRGVRIDWLKPVIPLYQHVIDRATDEDWLGHPVRVASAEGLILIKLLAYRPQDVVDIENLVAAHRDTLDLAWIQSEWATVGAADDPRMRRVIDLVTSRGRGP